MFRYEVGATILVKRYADTDSEPIEVKILARGRNVIKVEVLSGGWFELGAIRILTNDVWYSIGRIKDN